MYDRRYWRDSGIWMAGCLALAAATVAIAQQLPEGSVWRYVAAVPLCLFGLTAFWIERRQLQRFDEMQRAIYLEASLTAMWMTMAAIIVASFLEKIAGAPRIAPIWLLLVLGAGFAAGMLSAMRRFR